MTEYEIIKYILIGLFSGVLITWMYFRLKIEAVQYHKDMFRGLWEGHLEQHARLTAAHRKLKENIKDKNGRD